MLFSIEKFKNYYFLQTTEYYRADIRLIHVKCQKNYKLIQY